MTQPLTDAIEALTTYANSITGASDQTLSEAVATLVNGYRSESGSITSEGWQRPSDWPDYSLINLSNEEVLYLTYDTSFDPPFASFKFSDAFTVEIGTLTNGVFTVLETYNVASNTFWTKLLTAYTGYIVIKVRPNGGHLTGGQITYNHDGSDAGQTFWSSVQPLIEMYGNLPYMTNMDYFVRDAQYTKSVTLTGLVSVTSLERFAGDSIVIENIDLNGIPSTSKPSIYMAFNNCKRLKHLHLHGAGASLSHAAFQNCYMLEDTDLENLAMDTAGVSSLFSNCYSLPSDLDLSGWRVNASACSNLFFWCSFTNINISTWNLSGDFTNAFNTCSLKRIPAANYGVINNIGGIFSNALFEGVLDLRQFNFGTMTQLQAINYMPRIREIYVPANFTTIARNCFRDNFNMKIMHFEGTTPPTLADASAIKTNNKSLQKIYVPYSEDHSILNAYKTANIWSSMADMIEEEPQ